MLGKECRKAQKMFMISFHFFLHHHILVSVLSDIPNTSLSRVTQQVDLTSVASGSIKFAPPVYSLLMLGWPVNGEARIRLCISDFPSGPFILSSSAIFWDKAAKKNQKSLFHVYVRILKMELQSESTISTY